MGGYFGRGKSKRVKISSPGLLRGASQFGIKMTVMPTQKKPQVLAEAVIDPQMRYEEALKELEKLVSAMESGKLSLEETLTAYQRGAALLKHCQGVLAQVEQQVKIIET
jgi:exodeoxyribonuclease VII small subunit